MMIGKKQTYNVDDDESVRRTLGTILATNEFAVKAFSCPEEFLAVCRITLPVD